MENLDTDVKRLGQLVNLCEIVMKFVAEIQDKDEYLRVRDYLDSRFDLELPYSSPFIAEPAPTTTGKN